MTQFVFRCLRGVMKIKPTFVPQMSNMAVLRMAGLMEFSSLSLKRQLLLLYKNVARARRVRDITF